MHIYMIINQVPCAGGAPPADLERNIAWQARFDELKAFKAATGSLRIPNGVNDVLSRWCSTQRTARKEGSIHPTRLALLNDIGFEWSIIESSWEYQYEALKKFAAAHDRVDVAYLKNFNKNLAIWVNRQKGMMTREELTAAQIENLLALGVIPAIPTVRRTANEVAQLREATLQELAAHRAEHGHVQMAEDNNPESLFYRVRALRHIAVGRRDEKLRLRLVKLGAFDRFPDLSWETKFNEWKAYARAYGDPTCELAPKKLRSWYANVLWCLPPPGDQLAVPLARRYLGAGTKDFKSARAAASRLHAAGFVPTPPQSMRETDLLRAKLGELCHLNGIPLALRALLRLLTTRTRQGALSTELANRLERLGFVWHPKKLAWQKGDSGVRMLGALVTAPWPWPWALRRVATAAALLERTTSMPDMPRAMMERFWTGGMTVRKQSQLPSAAHGDALSDFEPLALVPRPWWMAGQWAGAFYLRY